MDPFEEDKPKEHSELWFWWRDVWTTFRGPLILFTVGVFGLFVVPYFVEADPWEYEDLPEWSKTYPQMVEPIREALEDGVLTEGEHWELDKMADEAHDQIRVEKALRKMK